MRPSIFRNFLLVTVITAVIVCAAIMMQSKARGEDFEAASVNTEYSTTLNAPDLCDDSTTNLLSEIVKTASKYNGKTISTTILTECPFFVMYNSEGNKIAKYYVYIDSLSQYSAYIYNDSSHIFYVLSYKGILSLTKIPGLYEMFIISSPPSLALCNNGSTACECLLLSGNWSYMQADAVFKSYPVSKETKELPQVELAYDSVITFSTSRMYDSISISVYDKNGKAVCSKLNQKELAAVNLAAGEKYFFYITVTWAKNSERDYCGEVVYSAEVNVK